MNGEALRRNAYHEAGHVVTAALLGLTVDAVSVRPGAHYLGVSIFAPTEPIVEGFLISGRRRGSSLLAQHGMVPVPLLDPEQRRRAETAIMIDLAGRLTEMMYGPPFSGFNADDDLPAALDIAATLSEPVLQLVAEAEERDDVITDGAHVSATALEVAGEGSAALTHWLEVETRRMVGAPLFGRLVEFVAAELLAQTVIAGEVVHAAVAREEAQLRRPTLVATTKEEITMAVRGKKLPDDDMVIALDGFMTADRLVPIDSLLRADDPLVLERPSMFIRASASQEEIGAALNALEETRSSSA